MSRASKAPSSFLYLAAGATGGRRLGVRQAGNKRQLAKILREDRLLMLSAWPMPAWMVSSQERMKLKDRAELNTQLSQLLGRGVPLVEALEVSAQTVSPRERARVERMRDLVSQGSSLAAACHQTGASDEVTASVYMAAERTGDLAGAAAQLASTARRQLAVGSKAITLMIYPAIVLSISLIVITALFAFVVPMIGKTLMEADIDINAFSRLVFSVGFFFRANLIWILLAFALIIVGAVLFRRGIGLFVAGIARKAPAFRELVLATESARFFSVMSAMTRGGVPIADALGVANKTISHPRLKSELDRLRQRLIDGGVLRLLIDDVESLPLATRRLLIAAERSGDLETAFNNLAEDMALEVDTRASRLLAAMEPALIVMLFAIVGSLLMSIMFPLLTAAGGIQ